MQVCKFGQNPSTSSKYSVGKPYFGHFRVPLWPLGPALALCKNTYSERPKRPPANTCIKLFVKGLLSPAVMSIASWFFFLHCLRVRYRTSRLRGYGSGTGPLDTDSRGPVPDTEPRLWGLSRGPVVCETTTDKSRDTGPYLHVYVVTVILPTKTHVEVSLCFKEKPICIYCHASHYSNNKAYTKGI